MFRDAGREIGLDGYGHAYFLRTSDEWTKIDYNKKTAEWMTPLVKGRETGLVRIPANGSLDGLL